jgi:restriction system protein
MAIPDYQTVMLPLLQATKDGKDHLLGDIIEELGNQLGLTANEKKKLVPSGTQSTFDNRVRWAGTYLFKAGLSDRTGWGVIRITSRGLDVLKENPTRIDVKFLRRFPEFRDFQQASKKAIRNRKSKGKKNRRHRKKS